MQLTKHWAAQLDDYVIDLGWSPDGSLLAAASGSGPVTLLAAGGGSREAELPGHQVGTNALSWRPGSMQLATAGQDGTVKLWDAAARQHAGTATLGNAWVEHIAWRPGGGTATLAATCGRRLLFLDADLSPRHEFAQAPKSLTALSWHPQGGCAAVAYFGGVSLWDADGFTAQRQYAYGNGINALAWSPEGKWLVSGNQDPSVHLWIPESDTELQMSGYEGKVRHLSFDQAGRWLATSGGSDACLWDCSGAGPEGREPVMLPHPAPVCAVAFQRSHGLLATASADGTLFLWSPERRQPMRATVKMPSAASRIDWSPDDGLLAIGSEAGLVYVLRCEP